MGYSQLTQDQRYVIKVLNKRGETQEDIADEIGVHKSTVCRELDRNEGQRGYRYKQAHRFAMERQKGKRDCRITDEDWEQIEDLIREEFSPEQISERFEHEDNGSISHEWIYEHIRQDKAEGGDLYTYCRHPKPYKKRGVEDGRGRHTNRTSIEDRPDIVDEKNRKGDWEADLVMGANHKGALVTMVERSTAYTLIGHVKRKTAEGVKEEQIRCLEPYREDVITLTTDNGREFAKHEQVADTLDVSIYFAHPYASWERGLNENTNGLIRQYFPKNEQLKEVDSDRIDEAVEKLNHRPRKSLNFRTPHEVFHDTTEQLTVALNS
jgi:IS30 family transposase